MELAEREVEYMKSNTQHTKSPTEDSLDLNQLSGYAKKTRYASHPETKKF